MKNSLLPLIFLVLIFSGCTVKHYYKEQGDEVVFYYKDADAREVLFASSLNNYKFLAARENKNHLWEVSVPGKEGFTYFYVIDGVIALPDCTFTENDDFGSKNCLYIPNM